MADISFQAFQHRFGRNLANLRRQRGMTQEQLARQVKLDPVTVAYLEGATRGPSFQTIYKLAKALKVNPMELFRF